MAHHPFLSTIAKRKAIAAAISAELSESFGAPVALAPCTLHPGDFSLCLEDYETERGPVRRVSIDVSALCVSVHSKFGFPAHAPSGANRYSGKWNHYFWPREGDTVESWRADMLFQLGHVAYELRPTGRVRADRPSPWETWRSDVLAL